MLRHMALKFAALSAVIVIGVALIISGIASSPYPMQSFMHSSMQTDGPDEAQAISVSIQK